ncbi:hypothetical protein [Candidatus Pelagisphaera phototrophica]|uniref:hypothetical protein n=1 Tax=Candidatus Pelagisphaera phototrophica TaxID=2684113 RepID=UPI0019EC272F|nr:hypothetical protein [Candidatus Pelagisphaera phototrophica]QXD32580.1 hypothetical protein GA004_02320 [Candidatus Pelagisphaera phototrophica]
MKSAYELAMERLQESDPDKQQVTDEMRKALAAVDEKFDAKVAERKIFLTQKLATATANQDLQEVELIQKQISNEKARLEEERETAKDKIRNVG